MLDYFAAHGFGALAFDGRGFRASTDFDESKHPRSDDGKFGSGHGSSQSSNDNAAPEKSVADVRKRVSEYPRTSVPLESSTVPAAAEAERRAQLQRSRGELSSIEHKALDSFMGGKFQDLRRAEIDGHPPDAAKEAKQLSRAIERFERKSKPTMCYRGLHVAPELAEKLMKADSFDGLATSMWSTQPSLGAQFSAGMSTKDRDKSVPIVLAGELKGMAADGDYGVEILMRNKTLKITGRERYEHPKFGTICVLKVAD
jgi:hypothetical protein